MAAPSMIASHSEWPLQGALPTIVEVIGLMRGTPGDGAGNQIRTRAFSV
jgi:hypothetical protein